MTIKKSSQHDLANLDDLLLDERVKLPRKYAVIIYNDDYTPQDFVVMVLQVFFAKEESEAHRLMLKVHLEGKAQAGIYTKDMAESKVQQVSAHARENKFPLRLSCEPL